MDLNILELFSGIGGMHYAFEYSLLKGKVIAAIDINTVANDVYSYNHKSTCLMNNNIQKLNIKTLQKLNINTILMSPPCQPHTRVGNKLDVDDRRSDALNHICELLPICNGIEFILMENVKGFEESQSRKVYIDVLEKSNYFYREFILSPSEMGIPNTRHRYYCVARKSKDFSFIGKQLWREIPLAKEQANNKMMLSDLLVQDQESLANFFLDETVLKRRVWLMDIVTAAASNTMCFTKAYTHYSEGTGSIYCPLPFEEMQSKFLILKKIEETEQNTENYEIKRLNLLHSLKLRYFTPREVARLMCFPESFDFPPTTTRKQKYRLLGNSINVKVVGELIKLMCL